MTVNLNSIGSPEIRPKYLNDLRDAVSGIKSKLCKELYNECYYILLNLSIKLNEKWSKNPTINTKEIELNTDRVEHYNEHDEVMWSLY